MNTDEKFDILPYIAPPLSWDNPKDVPILQWKLAQWGEEHARIATLPVAEYYAEASALQDACHHDEPDLQSLMYGNG